MDETIKIYNPIVVADVPFPQDQASLTDQSISSSSGSDNAIGPQAIQQQGFPDKRVSYEVLSSALNTKSLKILQNFQLAQQGGLQVGNYEQGVSGDVRITPGGIIARDQAGNTTFAVDGDTGDAVFAGEIRAGTLVSGLVVVGDNALIFDGANRNIIVNDGATDRILIGYQKGGF